MLSATITNSIEIEQNLNSGIFLSSEIMGNLCFLLFLQQHFNIFHKGLALLLKLKKGITFSVTTKRILLRLTSKHSWLKNEVKFSWKKTWVTEKVRNSAGEKPSEEVHPVAWSLSLPPQHLGTVNGC